jgi:histidine triad (HIT) family protein
MTTLDQTDPDCYICRKHRGEVSVPGGAIYEDDLVYAGHAQVHEGQTSAYLGYLMAEPKRHAAGLADLTDEEARSLGLLVARLSRALKTSEKAEHVYAFVLGDQVAHLHIHVVPRYAGAPREYWGVHVDEWPDAPHGGAEEMTTLCARLRGKMEKEYTKQG